MKKVILVFGAVIGLASCQSKQEVLQSKLTELEAQKDSASVVWEKKLNKMLAYSDSLDNGLATDYSKYWDLDMEVDFAEARYNAIEKDYLKVYEALKDINLGINK